MRLSSALSWSTERDVPALTITVIFSDEPRQVLEKVVRLEEGCTAHQALLASGLEPQLHAIGIDLEVADVGIWGKKISLNTVLRDMDRVEVYRPLKVDPKVARRERFAGQGAKKAAGLFAKRRLGAKAGY
jgi:putative ubiquitin-RnfH superfamily antitoxin RatB of RatAB toxin-antitoxin module